MSSSTTYPILPSRPVIPHITTTCSNPACGLPLQFPVPQPFPRPRTILQVRCFACQSVMDHTFYNEQVPSGSGSGSTVRTPDGGGGQKPQGQQQQRKGRKIGTQDRPLETGYYDILGISVNATSDDIKKAYRRLAIKHHPDKNPDDPLAEERFKSIAIAYQTLSDPALRAKYNEFGPKESAPEGGYVDPEEVFGAMFGGERFVSIIGHISLAHDMKTALQEAEDGEEEGAGDQVANQTGGGAGKERLRDAKGREILTPEEKAKKEEKERVKSERDRQRAAEKAAAREDRVKKLVENLQRKLGIFTESAVGPNDPDVSNSWRTICELEADDLKNESYGIELLQTIGFVYVSKAKHYLAADRTFFGVGGWLHNVQGKYHVFSETVSTLRAAVELKSVFDQIQAAEKAGNLSPEEKQKLEEQAAEKGIQALFKGTKLEVESVLRETCDRVLADPSITREKAQLRAVALQMLGEAYMGVKKDSSSPSASASAGGGGGSQGQGHSTSGGSGSGSGWGWGAGARGGGGGGGGGVDDSEYVRIDTKSSKERDGRRGDGR